MEFLFVKLPPTESCVKATVPTLVAMNWAVDVHCVPNESVVVAVTVVRAPGVSPDNVMVTGTSTNAVCGATVKRAASVEVVTKAEDAEDAALVAFHVKADAVE